MVLEVRGERGVLGMSPGLPAMQPWTEVPLPETGNSQTTGVRSWHVVLEEALNQLSGGQVAKGIHGQEFEGEV